MAQARRQELVEWIRVANIYDENAAGGASNLLVPLTHRALRANGVPVPPRVMLSSANGGRIVETAWDYVCGAAGRSEQWEELCDVSVAAIAHYIEVHGRATLSSLLAGEEEWPVLPDSDEPSAHATTAPMSPNGYIPRRAQEWLLSGPMGSGDARQYAAVLGAQLLAHYRA